MHFIVSLNQNYNEHNILISVVLLTLILVVLHETVGHLVNFIDFSCPLLCILTVVIYFSVLFKVLKCILIFHS